MVFVVFVGNGVCCVFVGDGVCVFVGVHDEFVACEGGHPQLHPGDGVREPLHAAAASLCARDTAAGAATAAGRPGRGRWQHQYMAPPMVHLSYPTTHPTSYPSTTPSKVLEGRHRWRQPMVLISKEYLGSGNL